MTPDEYAEMLLASGMPEREVARAYFYVKHFGMQAVEPDDPRMCAVFDEPTCHNWNCLNPDHQVLVFG